jgi:hypothetical protein
MAAEYGREATGADVGTLNQGFSIKVRQALAASPLTGARLLVTQLALLRVVSRQGLVGSGAQRLGFRNPDGA